MIKEGRTVRVPQANEEMYLAELRAFLAMTRGEAENHNALHTATNTLRLTLQED